jgi:DNA-binding HxlR family transcriptional regulator
MSLFMSKEKGEELFRALDVILEAITSRNLRDLEAEVVVHRGESSTKAATKS